VESLPSTKSNRRLWKTVSETGFATYKYTTIVLAIFGLVFLWESLGDGTIPTFYPHYDRAKYDPTKCTVIANDKWASIQPALEILDQINPTVSNWVRHQHDTNKLRFVDSDVACAKYDKLEGVLKINNNVLCYKDGVRAVALAHEYRHYRQSWAKWMRYLVCCAILQDKDASILENDAILYEYQAGTVIFGQRIDWCN
jgi:hypothetical protein